MRPIRLGLLTALLLTLAAAPARADIIDFGVNILSNGGTTQVEDGFWGDNNGYRLANSCVYVVICTQNSYQFAINTGDLDGDVDSAELSFDVSGQSLLEVFAVFALSGTYQFIGLLGSYPIDLNLAAFGDEIENGSLLLSVRTVTPWGESVRLDGANLRVESSDPTELINRVPEPGTLLLTGLGLAAAGILPRRRRQVA